MKPKIFICILFISELFSFTLLDPSRNLADLSDDIIILHRNDDPLWNNE